VRTSVTDEDPTNKRTSCPVCGAEAVPVAYGYATSETAEEADRGEVVLGGCVVGLPDGDPSWACLSCGLRFGRRETSPITRAP
jgi:transposase-like protein